MNPILTQLLWVGILFIGLGMGIPFFFEEGKKFFGTKLTWVPISGIIISNIPVFLAPFSIQPRITGFLELPLRITGIILTVLGVGLMVFSQKSLGKVIDRKSLSSTELITSGVYGQMRHPIYTARLFIVIGWSLTWSAVYSLMIFSIVTLIAFPTMVRFAEEPELIKNFGEEYKEYMKKVPAFFPLYIEIVLIALITVIIAFTITGLITLSKV